VFLLVKMGNVLLVLAILLAVLGVGASYSGYNASSQIVTETSTEPTSFASTMVAATTAESSVILTVSTRSLHDVFIIPPGWQQWNAPAMCSWDWIVMPVKPGKLYVSYSTGPSGSAGFLFGIDYSSVSATELEKEGHPPTPWPCSLLKGTVPYSFETGSASYKLTEDVASNGFAIMIFMNGYGSSVTVTVDAWQEPEQTQVTVTQYHTLWTTTWVPTQVVGLVTHPAGLGSLFYVGVILVVATIGSGVAGLMARRKGEVSLSTASAVTSPETPQTSLSKPTSVYCTECGAGNPLTNDCCAKCGQKLRQ